MVDQLSSSSSSSSSSSRSSSSSSSSFSLMVVLGLMPVVWRAAWDLSGKMWCRFGFFSIFLLLHGSGLRMMEKASFSVNKVVASGHLACWIRGVVMLRPAGRGGEGMKRSGASASASRGWWGWCLVQAGVSYTVVVLATVICGWKCGPSKAPSVVHAFLQPPQWRPLLELLAGVHASSLAKWHVPGDVKATGGLGSVPVERTNDVIVFSISVSGSFVQMSSSML